MATERMTAEQCVANIGSAGRQKRMAFGVVMFALAIGLLVGLLLFEAHRWWRLAVFVPLLLGATGIFQARGRT